MIIFRRTALFYIAVILILLNILLFFLNIAIGDRYIPVNEVFKVLLGREGVESNFIILELRLPRVLTGFLAGCGLALAGTILQVITRNPLASPGVIGINSGAAAAVVAIMVFVPSFSMKGLPWIAFGGAFAAATIIYIFSWRKGGMDSPARMLLMGISLSAMTGALITYLLTVGNIFRVSQASIWMAGSLYGRTWEHVWPLLPWILILFLLLLSLTRRLDMFLLDGQSALGLGLRVETWRMLFILISVGLAGSAVSMVGTIGFVGLMAPHIAMYLVGHRSLIRLPISALIGGLIVMMADLVGRTGFAPFEVPAGLITAIIGAPYMIYLLLKPRVL
ncbi:iron complex transport system permease protein [Paenibacillus shirakamiensis]|uniref:Iron complex transport system permease protein n=1 Tax=Paenibacillus shirakamiensis TaxID=1265935 RepID=A0ABS4JE22_9BACL|nr:iron chelate uptake ABC transporter family permease subunit [Paenibacillus shirakamiensis]MBP1999971.1 iron complex transport system permease protein [Paenibacillus shirakamiensis]